MEGDHPRLGTIKGLNGIRAFAVLAVIGFHSGTWLPGGFYGVDAFFVLSGFLITSLLVAEWNSQKTISLSRFWARRARRLLPGLFVMVFVVGLVTLLWKNSYTTHDLFAAACSTIFYYANWFYFSFHANYFSTAATLPFQHTWSLAIEEQFYLIWPLVIACFALRRNPNSEQHLRSRLQTLLFLSIFGALGSAALMWIQVKGTVLNVTTSKAYFATDTRAQALLVGAALAFFFALRKLSRTPDKPPNRRFYGVFGLVGLIGTGLAWSKLSTSSYVAFHGGFLLVSVGTAGVIAHVVVSQEGVLAKSLSLAPLDWLGRVSYGVYLWYWPVFLIMTGTRMHETRWALLSERLPVIVGIAAVSFYLVEQPIRRGRLPQWRALLLAPIAGGIALLTVFSGVAVADAPTPSTAHETTLSVPKSSTSSTYAALTTLLHQPFTRSPLIPGEATIGGSNIAAFSPGAHPVKVLLLGDSIAGSLGVGLDQIAASYNIELINEGHPNCAVASNQTTEVQGRVIAPQKPCVDDDPTAVFAQWRSWIDQFNPDVVVYVARSDLFQNRVNGTWGHVGQPSFDSYLEQRFLTAIGIWTSHGASVALLSSAYYDGGSQPDGALWTEDTPNRATRYDQLLQSVAQKASDAGTLTAKEKIEVVPFGTLVAPDKKFQPVVTGVEMRCIDGVHFTVAGGEWYGQKVLGSLAKLGRHHHHLTPLGSWTGTPPPPEPIWYPKLPC